jgi:23S rRNA pseudouridine2605 synthase
MQQRLQKILAHAGIASRRECEEIIAAGRVTVNGKIITELGSKADTETDDIRCDGEPVKAEKLVYFLLNKPAGVLCTNEKTFGQKRVVDLFPGIAQRLYTVGRLDGESTGLLIVTNDGELANRIAHPRYEVDKTYAVAVKGWLEGPALDKVQKGVWLAEGRTGRARVRILKRTRQMTLLEITIHEGKNREIRRVFARVGHPVASLRRIQIGGLFLGKLREGQWVPIDRDSLLRKIGLDPGTLEPAAGGASASPRPPLKARVRREAEEGPEETAEEAAEAPEGAAEPAEGVPSESGAEEAGVAEEAGGGLSDEELEGMLEEAGEFDEEDDDEEEGVEDSEGVEEGPRTVPKQGREARTGGRGGRDWTEGRRERSEWEGRGRERTGGGWRGGGGGAWGERREPSGGGWRSGEDREGGPRRDRSGGAWRGGETREWVRREKSGGNWRGGGARGGGPRRERPGGEWRGGGAREGGPRREGSGGGRGGGPQREHGGGPRRERDRREDRERGRPWQGPRQDHAGGDWRRRKEREGGGGWKGPRRDRGSEGGRPWEPRGGPGGGGKPFHKKDGPHPGGGKPFRGGGGKPRNGPRRDRDR